MKFPIILTAALLAGVISIQPALAHSTKPSVGVEVSMVEAQKLGDIELSNTSLKRSARQIQKDMTRLLEDIAKDYLEPGSQIKIKITKLDLPGYVDWNTGNARSIRVIRQSDFMKITFDYEVTNANGHSVKGTETLKSFYEPASKRTQIRPAGSAEYFRELMENWLKEKLAAR